MVKIIILNTVQDDQLLATNFATLFLMLVLCLGIAFSMMRIIKKNELKNRIRFLIYIILLSVALIPTSRAYLREHSMLYKYEYTQGKTLEFCKESFKGQGVMFEYTVNGTRYELCNTPHPIPINEISMGTSYKVRYSPDYPEKGRMDFSQVMK